MSRYSSWGRFLYAESERVQPAWRDDIVLAEQKNLPRGYGRSYGDSCLVDGGTVIEMTGLNRFIAFDKTTGLLRAEAGVSLADILRVCVPAGWFLPVTPGTKFVSLGGACANDVHGKNHLRDGSFGNHVTQVELLRSSGERLLLSRTTNPELFAATIGGLGLTGAIVWVELQLAPIQSAYVDDNSRQCQNLSELLVCFDETRETHQHRVAWLDCNAKGADIGRSIFSAANYAQIGALANLQSSPLTVPFAPPISPLSRTTVSAFNWLYYRKLRAAEKESLQHYDAFFYPLDNIHDWNKIYGRKGFLQYQCVISDNVADGLRALLNRISDSGQASFLSVLKELGEQSSPGLLSFPKAGYTLALDFPNKGKATLKLLNDLDAITREHAGRVYPAKDARMSAEMFTYGYGEKIEQFNQYRDPAFNSDFWRRVTKS